MSAFTLWLALAVGNFLWQAAVDGDYGRAVERSWFQGVAIGLYAMWDRFAQ